LVSAGILRHCVLSSLNFERKDGKWGVIEDKSESKLTLAAHRLKQDYAKVEINALITKTFLVTFCSHNNAHL